MMIEPASFLMMNVVCVVQVSVCEVCQCVIVIVIVIAFVSVGVWPVVVSMMMRHVHAWMMIENDRYGHLSYWMTHFYSFYDHHACVWMVMMMMMMMVMIASSPFLSHL